MSDSRSEGPADEDPADEDGAGGEPRGARPAKTPGRHLLEWAAVFVVAIGVYAGVRTFLVQAFSIPSTSMLPTLEVGDRILVNKLSYEVGEIERGDIVVFSRPPLSCDDEIADLIKRVVAHAGESVAFDDGSVFIDGRELNEPYLQPGTLTTGEGQANRCPPDDPCVIPPGHVWVMGDNRAGSCDSRTFGPIPESTIVGEAFVRIWPPSRISGL
jgi:signal peptidase I